MSADASANQERTPITAGRRVRFGVFEFDCAPCGELTKRGTRVHLQEQPARLLAVLIENAGRTVSRDELRQCLWTNDTFVDFEHGLNTAIRKLRVALDDTADTPRWIETVPRSGYRFIGSIEVTGGVPATATAYRSRAARLWIIGAAVVAVVALASAALLRERSATRGEPIDAIAVLPFTNQDAQTRHLSDGMTEALINGLAAIRDLRVMARATVFEFAGTAVNAKRAGQKLDVPAVVAGSLQLHGDQVALQVEMIDVRDGAQLWGRHYVGTRRSIQTLQRQIIDDLSRQLRPGATKAVASRTPTTSTGPDAYELYLKGLHAWNKRHPNDLELAVQYFHEALKIDPQFALAWAGLANAWGVMAGSGWYPASVMQPRASAAAEKALAIDPNLAEAITTRAAGMYQQEYDFDGAEREFLRAIALNPSYPTVHAWYSQLLTDLGRPDEARVQVELAYQLDPLSPAINHNRCWNYFYERRYEEAIAFGRKVGALDARFRPRPCLFHSLAALGRDEEAITELTVPGWVFENDRTAVLEAYRRAGRPGMAHAWVEALRKWRGDDYISPIRFAAIYAWAGDTERAFTWLEKARAERASRLASFYEDPAYDPIRNDPRFEQFARKIGLPQVGK